LSVNVSLFWRLLERALSIVNHPHVATDIWISLCRRPAMMEVRSMEMDAINSVASKTALTVKIGLKTQPVIAIPAQ
jgi:hypothetical protein